MILEFPANGPRGALLHQAVKSGCQGLCLVVLALGTAAFARPAAAGDELTWGPLTLHGFVEGRAILADGVQSWVTGGLGKTRFGGEAGAGLIGRLQAAATLQVAIGWDWAVIATATASGQQYHLVDAQEVFLRYKPAPAGTLAVEVKAGVFFPPVSLENAGLAWTSPYTLSSSALNSWVGEELRAVGAEVSATYRGEITDEPVKLRTTAGVYGLNQPAGSLLAYRGWAIGDRTAGVFERFPVSPLKAIQPEGSFPLQAPWVEPLHQIDGRPGYYAGLSLESEQRDMIRVLYYDNRADSTAFDGRQYAWQTRFLSLGVKTTLPGDVDLLAQAMSGRTTMKFRPPPLGPVVDMDFRAAYALASRTWDAHRITVRLDYFDTRDLDTTPDDNNNERGNAVTVAYTFRPADHHRFTLEAVRLHSDRAGRALEGLGRKATQTTALASWRITY